MKEIVYGRIEQTVEQARNWFEEQKFIPLRTMVDPQRRSLTCLVKFTEYFIFRERVCFFAAITLGQEQETFAKQ